LLAAEAWGLPPWQISRETMTDWTAIKWLMRRGFVESERNRKAETERKRRETEARLNRHGK